MAYAVGVISPQRASLFIVAVAIDVVRDDLLQAVLAAVQHSAGLHRGYCGILRAEDDIVNLALARRELAVGRERARDIGGIASIFAAYVHHHHVAVFNLVIQRAVVQHRGVETGAHDGRVRFAFASAPFVDFLHARGDLVFEKPRAHVSSWRRNARRSDRSIAFCISANSPGDFT